MLRSNQYPYERQFSVSALNNADDHIYWMDGAGTAIDDSLFRVIIIEKIITNCFVVCNLIEILFHTQYCFAFWGAQSLPFNDVFDSLMCSSSHATCTSLVCLGNNDVFFKWKVAINLVWSDLTSVYFSPSPEYRLTSIYWFSLTILAQFRCTCVHVWMHALCAYCFKAAPHAWNLV